MNVVCEHGGDWTSYADEYGSLPLDFSASISPLGMPEAAVRAATDALNVADRYPDPFCRSLRAALSSCHCIPDDRIVCGNGAADLIDRIVRTVRPRCALLLSPSFSEYERALSEFGCSVRFWNLSEENGFHLTEQFLGALTEDIDLVFLCQPNNPTCVPVSPELSVSILKRCAEMRAHLVTDECFLDFTADPDRYSLRRFLPEHRNLTVLRAFTKTYAMAGLRLGYALCSDASFAARLQACGQPWAVSAPAQAAGIAALTDPDYLATLRTLIVKERARLLEGLAALGMKVIPGEANFLLFRSEKQDLAERLRCRGILLRDCSTFSGLGAGWYRCAVRTEDENKLFLRTMEEIL